MSQWIEQELYSSDLGDTRRNRRLVKLVQALSAKPRASVPEACGSWSATKAAYRFWDNDQVSDEAIRAGHIESTRKRCEASGTVLAIQDTSDLDYTSHPGTEGLGYLQPSYCQGLKVHSVFAVSSDGLPLGLVDQHIWAREVAEIGKNAARKKKATVEKESQRWLEALSHTGDVLGSVKRVITVADREADIYDLFAQGRVPGQELLIRAAQDRCIEQSDARLWQQLRQTAKAGEMELALKRRPDRAARQALLSLRYTSVSIQPPRSYKGRAQLPSIKLQALLAEEMPPPSDGGKPICWLLLTTLPIGCWDQAMDCLRWYSYRWLIERYHYVLKSGCGIERLELETAERLKRALATYSLVAWRLLWLSYLARQRPDQSCECAYEPIEWHALYATIHQSGELPEAPPSLRQAVRWTAQLGGFLARKSDGEPGVKTLWRGLQRLDDIVRTWKLAATVAATNGFVGNA